MKILDSYLAMCFIALSSREFLLGDTNKVLQVHISEKVIKHFFRDWILVQQRIREHQDFDRWFVEYPEVRYIEGF